MALMPETMIDRYKPLIYNYKLGVFPVYNVIYICIFGKNNDYLYAFLI